MDGRTDGHQVHRYIPQTFQSGNKNRSHYHTYLKNQHHIKFFKVGPIFRYYKPQPFMCHLLVTISACTKLFKITRHKFRPKFSFFSIIIGFCGCMDIYTVCISAFISLFLSDFSRLHFSLLCIYTYFSGILKKSLQSEEKLLDVHLQMRDLWNLS